MKLLLLLFSLTALYARLLPSVVRLDNATRPICSAIAVSALDAALLTAGHCVDGQDALFVGGREVVVVRRAHRDLALLEWQPVFDFSKPKLKAVTLAKNSPTPGTAVAAIGYPYGDVPVVFGGAWASVVGADSLVWIDVHAIPGMSGGGVFDTRGRLLTVVQGASGGVLVAEPTEVVRRFVSGR